MSEGETKTVLRPSFLRAWTRLQSIVLFFGGALVIVDHHRTGKWWIAEFYILLIVSLLAWPALVCVSWVPERIEWTESEFHIRSKLGPEHTLPWADLFEYGHVRNFFQLEFNGVSTFHINTDGFDPAEWRSFESFLETNFPERKIRAGFKRRAVRRDGDA